MALLRSLLTGISGLRAQQTALDVTGDNISNVSTVGFKGSRVNFSTLISQTQKFGQAPSGFLGGTNASQVGLGVQVADVQRLWTQGQLRQTGLATDLAIDDGENARTFFVLNDYSGRNIFTRDGTFGLNRENELFDPSSGYKVQGWMADTATQVVDPTGAIDFSLNTGGQLEDINIEIGNLTIAKETTYTDWRGNLNGAGDVADNASVLESEALFDMSSGVLVPATENTLLQNLARSSTGDSAGNPIDLNMQIGSVVEIEANVGGTRVVREFIVGDPPPTGGMTLGDLRDWMQGATGINRSDDPGSEMISAIRNNAVTGEAVNGTLDQVGNTGFLSLTLGGADFQSVAGTSGLANVNGTSSFTLDISDAGGTPIVAGATVNVTGTGAGGLITSQDVENALNAAAATANLAPQFNVSGSFSAGFTISNEAGNSFTMTDAGAAPADGATAITGGSPAVAGNTPNLGVSQQALFQSGDTITFDNFQPLMAAQTLTAVSSGTGNGANQFEIGASVAETAANLATSINTNPALSGLVTASVVGNQIQLQANRPGMDGNFAIQTSLTNADAIVPSTIGINVNNATAGDTFELSSDGSPVASTLSSSLDASLFAAPVAGGLTAEGAAGTVDLNVEIDNLPNSPIAISIPDDPAMWASADMAGFLDAVVNAINTDANVVAAGVANFSVTALNATTGNFTITSTDNARFGITSSSSDADDFSRVFTSAAASQSNGMRIQLVPENGSAQVGFTAVNVGETPSITTKSLADAINSNIYVNPPIGATGVGSFLRITDESSIESGQGNAVTASSLIQGLSAGFTQELGNSLIGAGASADQFIAPEPTDFAEGTAIGTIIDDEVDFVAAGVQVGDFIRFSTGPSAGMIAKVTHVGMVEDTVVPGNLLPNPHALRFEVQNTDVFPAATTPSAYTIHEAASVDIGVDSSLAAANPPIGMDTASNAGVLRISGHVGTANRINSIDLRVKNPNGTQNVLAGFNTINDAAGESFRTSTIMYDSLGVAREVNFTYWLESKSNGGTAWRWQATAEDNNVTPGTEIQTVVGTGTLNFDTQGRYISDSGTQVRIDLDDFGVDEPLIFSLNLSQLTGFAADTSPDGSVSNPTEVFLFNQDGFKAGTLEDFTIGSDGRVTGFFNNGLNRTLGQIATARFANPAGLVSTGENYFQEDVNSGRALIGEAGNAGRGIIRSGFLEEANIELAEQFTDLITAQRAFQANARTITTSSQLLQELVNLS